MTAFTTAKQKLAHVFDAAGKAVCGLPAKAGQKVTAGACPVCFSKAQEATA